MKILKHGDLQPRKFTCPECGCIFVANRTEYEVRNSITYLTVCPDCNYDLFTTLQYAPLFKEEKENENKDNY